MAPLLCTEAKKMLSLNWVDRGNHLFFKEKIT